MLSPALISERAARSAAAFGECYLVRVGFYDQDCYNNPGPSDKDMASAKQLAKCHDLTVQKLGPVG